MAPHSVTGLGSTEKFKEGLASDSWVPPGRPPPSPPQPSQLHHLDHHQFYPNSVITIHDHNSLITTPSRPPPPSHSAPSQHSYPHFFLTLPDSITTPLTPLGLIPCSVSKDVPGSVFPCTHLIPGRAPDLLCRLPSYHPSPTWKAKSSLVLGASRRAPEYPHAIFVKILSRIHEFTESALS